MAQHQTAKSLAQQYGVKLAFEPFGSPHQSIEPEVD
jgi:hypothetical protein